MRLWRVAWMPTPLSLLRASRRDGLRMCTLDRRVSGEMVTRISPTILIAVAMACGCASEVRESNPPRETNPQESGDGGGDGEDAGTIDGGATNGVGGPQLKWCESSEECPNPTATCQSGYCCTGTLNDNVCMCGDEPGCNLTQVCCRPLGAPAGVVSCVVSISGCHESPF